MQFTWLNFRAKNVEIMELASVAFVCHFIYIGLDGLDAAGIVFGINPKKKWKMSGRIQTWMKSCCPFSLFLVNLIFNPFEDFETNYILQITNNSFYERTDASIASMQEPEKIQSIEHTCRLHFQ